MGVIVAVVVGLAVLGGFAVVLSLTDSPMSVEPVDRIDPGLPERPLTSHDVAGLRFRVGLRGYRMDDVDAALDRLRDALAEAEERSAAAQVASQPADGALPARPRRRRTDPPLTEPE